MTIEEVYNQVRQFTPAERARIRDFIDSLNQEPPSTAHSEAELKNMLITGINSGKPIQADEEYWTTKERRVTERQGPA